MDEKKYSVDEILAEAHMRSSAHSRRHVTAQREGEAQKIAAGYRNAAGEHDDVDALLREIHSQRAAREAAGVKAPSVKTEAATPPQEKQKQASAPKMRALEAKKRGSAPKAHGEKAKKHASAPVAKPVDEIQMVPAKAEKPQMPQNPREHKSIDEVLREVVPGDNKIDNALADKKEEKAGKRESKLTRTGVIRKATELIEQAEKPQPASPEASVGAAQSGSLQRQEKIVGEKEDIQTKAYHTYIRNKQKKKQDTGMIKATGIKNEEKTKQVAHLTQSDNSKTKVHALGVIDKQTDAEKTIAGRNDKRVISNINHTGNIEGQTRLEGFFDDNEVEKISEDELEEQLELNRREKIDAFSLEKSFKDQNRQAVETSSLHSIDDTYAPEKETPVINDVIDYNSKNDQRAVYIELEQLANRFKVRTVLNFAAEIVAVIIGIFGSGILSDFGLGTGNERVYIVINTAILLLMIIFNGRALIKGIKTLFLLKPSADSFMAFAALITAAHCVLSLTLGEGGAGVSHLYVGALGFVFLLNCFGKRSMTRRIFKNFRFLIKKGEKYTAACITQPKEIKEFSKEEDLENIDIRYNASTEFATRFLANSYADDPSDSVAKIAVYPVIGLSLLVGLITFFIGKDILAAISAATAIALIGVPASSIMAFNKALENADAALLKERGTITGFAAVKDAAETTSVVLRGDELFPAGTCSLKGMKLFKRMQMDEAILYAASVLSETVHPLKPVFMESISEVKERMPKSFDTAYEAKLGLSTWIYDRKVLLGNREMMGAHGIEIPATAKPEEYTAKNKRVMFLAIDGSVYAMFVVEYYSDSETEYELQRLEASGIEVLIKTEDSNLDAELISTVFDLELSSVKILSMIASNMYEEKTAQPVYNEAKIINRGDPITFMRSITACSILNGQFSLLKMLQYISLGLGVVIIALLSFLGSISAIGPVHIAVYGAFWMVVTNIIPRIYKAVPKR